MTVGTVGVVRTPPKPTSAVASEALNLMSALGGGDPKVRKLLEEMRDVQAHNERVRDEARTALADAQRRLEEAQAAERAAIEAQTKLANDTATKTAELAERERVLKEDRARFESETTAKAQELAKTLDEATERQRQAGEAETRNIARAKTLDARQEALEAKAEELNTRERDLNARVAAARQFIAGV